MRRPDWWPRPLWPGEQSSPVPPDPRAGSPGAGEGAGIGRRDDRTMEEAPWPSLLELLLASLGAASGAVWRLEGERWTVLAERARPGWSSAERRERSARGHPFTWSLREDLILQTPADRIAGDGREGWSLLVPVPRGRRLLELWFPSAPGPSVREATAAIQGHLAWLAEARRDPDEAG